MTSVFFFSLHLKSAPWLCRHVQKLVVRRYFSLLSYITSMSPLRFPHLIKKQRSWHSAVHPTLCCTSRPPWPQPLRCVIVGGVLSVMGVSSRLQQACTCLAPTVFHPLRLIPTSLVPALYFFNECHRVSSCLPIVSLSPVFFSVI